MRLRDPGTQERRFPDYQGVDFSWRDRDQHKFIQKDDIMRAMLIPAALIAALATATPIEPAQAAGCIKGAIAGGLAGHAVGHGVLGAAGGCLAGRTIANRSARQRQLEQQNMQNGSQSYSSGGVQSPNGYTQGPSQRQGYVPNQQGLGYNPPATQQGTSYTPGVLQN